MSQCCAALLNLRFLDLSSHYALACSRKFGDLLMNDTEALTKILRDYGVSMIVCGRFLIKNGLGGFHDHIVINTLLL